jgi:S1-C subfamily serine protease
MCLDSDDPRLKENVYEGNARAKDDLRINEDTSPKSSGTGFLITSDGYIITADHVVSNAQSVKVLTNDGLLPAQVVRRSESEDIAILKIQDSNYSSLPLKSSRSVKLGSEVFTIGFPNIGLQGFEPKFTKGYISSLAGLQDKPKHFQISVPVQSGNSGGPLVDGDGNVIGVVVYMLSEEVTYQLTGNLPQNVNYAVKGSFVLAMLEAIPELASKLKQLYSKNNSNHDKVVEQVKESIVLILKRLIRKAISNGNLLNW